MQHYNQGYDELYHYGVLGMKWGRRSARGHGGPGKYLTKKRQEAGDRNDLNALNNGQHLSVGFGKKRQEAYDQRDKAILEKRLVDNKRTGEKKSIRQTLKERDAYIQKNRIERAKMKADAKVAWKKAHEASNSNKYDEEKANKLWDEYETLSGGQKYRDLDKRASRMKTGETAALAYIMLVL